MSEKNVLVKMTMEKARLINKLISEFLGHEPLPEEKRQFHVLSRLGESIVYYRGELIGIVKHEAEDEPLI